MRPRLRVLPGFSVLLAATCVAGPAWANHLVLSASDGKYPMIEGVYKVADPPPPDIMTVLDASSFPPRVVGEVEVSHSVVGPPTCVAITPDEKLALVGAPMKVDPNDKTKLAPESILQVVDLETSPPTVISRMALPSRPVGVSINRDRKSTRLNSSHSRASRMPSSA